MRCTFYTAVWYILVCLYAHAACAQVNIEKLRNNAQKAGFSGTIELDVSHRTGNVELTTMEVESRLDHVRDTMQSFVIIRNDYGWQGGKQFSNEGLIHVRHVFRTQSAVQPEIFVQSDYNKKRLLTYRALAGLGVRRVLCRNANMAFTAGTAFMPEREEYNVDDTNSQNKEVTVFRWSNYISANIPLCKHTRWTSTTYIQPDLEDFGDIRVLADTELSIKLFTQWSLVIAFNLRYDSEPPDGIESIDTELEPGLVFVF